jgi:hypothetical protein|tara:strand:+ start:1168 stop:1899 length:732 start_codon:yes stop_codon:yes gene_type:complete
MNNTKLLRFIDKYHLGGEIKSVKWVSNGNKLSTRFISGDKSVVGSVVLDKFDGIDSSELGVYNTSQLISLLTILGDDIKFNLSSAGEKFISIDMVDTTRNTKSKYMLSDLSVIPTPPPMKNLPDKFELKLDVTSYFINTFINGKSALPDSDSFTILCKDGKVDVVIGYSSIASNRVTIPIETSEYEDIEPISFNAKMFANILSSNKECESATLEVSSAGLSRIKFKVDDYSSEYYLVATQQVN